ncbi:hypothetical protein ACFSTH_16665 [Paenibacillus yanchengensis]|uniref:Uncharacterized protein n=1 Tax=Paenibacillus yanchengensis TaxID=2035833 RepID=A0ABW4YPP7_9BACL
MKECIFHFKLTRGKETEALRGLLFLGDDERPQMKDFLAAFTQMGYKVKRDHDYELKFTSLDPKDPFQIEITKLEIKGEKKDQAAIDAELKAILEQLIKPSW